MAPATGVTLSRDGQYVAYLVGSGGGEGEAIVRHVGSGRNTASSAGALVVLPNGNIVYGTPRFAPDGKQALLPLPPTKAATDKAKAEKRKLDDYPKATLAIVDLTSGKELDRIEGVTNFQVGGEGVGFVVYRKGSPPDTSKGPATPSPKGKGPLPPQTNPPQTKTTGSDLYIRDLSSSVARTIPDVTEYNLSHDEKTLVYVVSSKSEQKERRVYVEPAFQYRQ